MSDEVPEGFDMVGPSDVIESRICSIVCGSDWEPPEGFDDETTMWHFANERLEPDGYVTIIEDTSYTTDNVGLDFGWYALLLDPSEAETRRYARDVIESEYGT